MIRKKQTYTLRPYQQEASDRAVEFFTDSSRIHNALMVMSTGSGKSLTIADIAYRLNANVLVFCPSKELVEQNYEKMCSYGVECSMYSSSVGKKVISQITFATIGSTMRQMDEFKIFDYIIIDECHLVSSKSGMYYKMIKSLKKKVLGLTATPYRLESDVDMDYKTKTFKGAKSYLMMLTSYKRAIFKEIIYNLDTAVLQNQGYLSKLRYYNIPPQGWNSDNLFKNSSGSDYSEKSVLWMQEKVDFFSYMVNIVQRLLKPKSGQPRNGILVFVRFKEDAKALCKALGSICVMVSSDTKKKDRERIIEGFRKGRIKVLVNVSVLTTGFDYPALDTIVFARATMSLALYTQVIGRCLRIDKNKDEGWIVDIVGNFNKFGSVSDLRLLRNEKGEWNVYSGFRQLTNIYL